MAKHKQPLLQPETTGRPRMKNKEYQRELRRLHGELVAMQEWVKATGAKVCIVFEGRDTAGKGGTIKAITERVSPRVFRVVALPAPTERERSLVHHDSARSDHGSGAPVTVGPSPCSLDS